MNSSEIVDAGLRVYQMLGWTFLKLTALPSVFCLASLAFLTEYIFPALFVTEHSTNVNAQMGEVVVAVAMALFIGGPLFLIGFSYSTALVAQLVSDYMVGNVPSADAARQTAMRSLPRLLRVNMRLMLLASSGLVISIGLLMLSAYLSEHTPEQSAWAGIIAFVAVCGILASGVVFLLVIGWEAIATPVAVIEKRNAVDAGRRSRDLLKGTTYIQSGYNTVANLYAVIGVVSLMMIGGLYGSLGLINYQGNAEAFVSALPFGALLLKASEMLPLYLFVWTMIPVWAVTVTIIYYERRVRKEGYDIEALAGDVWRSDRQNRFEL